MYRSRTSCRDSRGLRTDVAPQRRVVSLCVIVEAVRYTEVASPSPFPSPLSLTLSLSRESEGSPFLSRCSSERQSYRGSLRAKRFLLHRVPLVSR